MLTRISFALWQPFFLDVPLGQSLQRLRNCFQRIDFAAGAYGVDVLRFPALANAVMPLKCEAL
jgi:hypothetical protein